eukprot:843837-Amphidinium_carterae.1
MFSKGLAMRRLFMDQGMFLAVPIMAAVKYYMLSIDMPHQYRDKLLVFIEGSDVRSHMWM